MQFEFLEKGNENICEFVLRLLPDWFGIEESTLSYIRKSKELPMIVARDDGEAVGFLSLLQHSPHTFEIYVMGVVPEFHRNGVGEMLIVEAERFLSKKGVEFLQVKTVSADRECEFYKKTRLFYKKCGFKEVEVFPTIWGVSNPCQLLIKSVKTKIRGINHITLSVSNLEKSFSFYKNTLGFSPKFKNQKSVYFLAGDLWFAIEEDLKVRKEALPEYTHIAFDVSISEFDLIVERIKNSGATIFKEDISEGSSLYFLDPDGHKLEVHNGSLQSRLNEYRKSPREGYEFFD